MSLTLSNIASLVLRDVDVPEDSSTTQALIDCKSYINERARKIWRMETWAEYNLLGSIVVPASTNRFALSSIIKDSGFTSGSGFNATFAQVLSIREGTNALMPEDPNAIHKLQPDLWASTATPSIYIPFGQQGIRLLGQYSVATTLNVFGKADFQDLTDTESWVMDEFGDALLLGAAADFIRYHERDDNRANVKESMYQAEVARLIHERTVQGANMVRVIPLNPWTKDFRMQRDVSRIGINNY